MSFANKLNEFVTRVQSPIILSEKETAFLRKELSKSDEFEKVNREDIEDGTFFAQMLFENLDYAKVYFRGLDDETLQVNLESGIECPPDLEDIVQQCISRILYRRVEAYKIASPDRKPTKVKIPSPEVEFHEPGEVSDDDSEDLADPGMTQHLKAVANFSPAASASSEDEGMPTWIFPREEKTKKSDILPTPSTPTQAWLSQVHPDCTIPPLSPTAPPSSPARSSGVQTPEDSDRVRAQLRKAEMKSKSKEKASEKFSWRCGKCDKSFKSARGLKVHEKIHKDGWKESTESREEMVECKEPSFDNPDVPCGRKFGKGHAIGGHVRAHRAHQKKMEEEKKRQKKKEKKIKKKSTTSKKRKNKSKEEEKPPKKTKVAHPTFVRNPVAFEVVESNPPEAQSDRQSLFWGGYCIICDTRRRSVAFKPCGHVALCGSCAGKVTHCPVNGCRCVKFMNLEFNCQLDENFVETELGPDEKYE